jgi:hypothetical protein
MRKLFMAVIAAGFVLSAVPAFAETYTGTFEGIDQETNTLFVDQDVEFVMPYDIDLPELQPGEIVTIEYDEIDGQMVIREITQAE